MGWLSLVGSLKFIGLFCKRALEKRQYSGKETYNLIDPTNRSHPIYIHMCICMYKSYTYDRTHIRRLINFLIIEKHDIQLECRVPTTLQTCKNMCLHSFMHACMPTIIHTYITTLIHTYITNIRRTRHPHTRTYTHAHTYLHTYKHTNIRGIDVFIQPKKKGGT